MLNYIVWNVRPEIFTLPEDLWLIGGFSVRWYGLLFACAFIFGYIIMQRIFNKENIPIKVLDELTTYMVVSVIVGARLGHCLFYEPGYYLTHPFEILKIWGRRFSQPWCLNRHSYWPSGSLRVKTTSHLFGLWTALEL